MTIIDQHATCVTEYADWRSQDTGDGHAVILRPHEVLIEATPIEHGYCGGCGKPCLAVKTCWDHRITTDDARGGPGTWKLGEDTFPSVRHADGTGCGEIPKYVSFPDPTPTEPNRRGGKYEGTEPRYQVYLKSVCSNCKAIDSLSTKQEAYGDRVTCQVCGDENYYSIGD